MSFFFRAVISALLVISFPIKTILAVNISALYLSDCEREIGIVLDVDDSDVTLLSLEGQVKKIRQFEIIYVSNYTLDTIPINGQVDGAMVDLFKIDTLQNNRIVNLVKGWPIDFTERNISFLTLSGKELVIARDNIWSLEIEKPPRDLEFIKMVTYKYDFIHPYPFRNCPIQYEGNTKQDIEIRKVFPEKILSDAVRIKREFDRIREGKKVVHTYNRTQQFYPVPHLYTNKTTLGYWFSAGSRYGASKSRTNNLSPILANEFSSGPFGYQHLFLTGSAPVPYSIHEEPQSQIYYRFKADYFHLGLMVDPNLFLVGEKYFWKDDYISGKDDRVNGFASFEFGFDYGPVTVQMYIEGVSFGAKYNGQELMGGTTSNRFGASYRNHLFKVEWFTELALFYGKEEGQHQTVKVARLNVDLLFIKQMELSYSFIYRMLSLKSIEDWETNFFEYSSSSATNAFYCHYAYNHKFNFGAFASLEYHSNNYVFEDSKQSGFNFYPKGGIFASLNF